MTTEFYKEFRPQSLKKIVGNTETVGALIKMLDSKKLPHTLLFSGPSGCGKTTIARILRIELACGDLDYRELNCANFRGIDTIREIESQMKLSPIGGGARVWILDEFHMMSREGQNAALKMLEDTPSHVFFFICTTDPDKLIPAIRTRCTHLPVRLLNGDEIDAVIQRIVKLAEISEPTARVIDGIIKNAGGSARRAIVLLEQTHNLKDEEAQLQALSDSEGSPIEATAKKLVEMIVLGKGSWADICKHLKTIKEEPEEIRYAVLGFARGVLLNRPDGKAAHPYYNVICAFREPFYNSKTAGLAAACYEAIFGS